MKPLLPHERAMMRDPECAFIDAVVDGFSPINAEICALARHGAYLRALPSWESIPYNPYNGSVRWRDGAKQMLRFCNETAGDCP